MSRIDRSKMIIKKKGFGFKPFRPTLAHKVLLADAQFEATTELLVFERGGKRRALLLPEMAYHHVCQGELAGEPYLVSF